LAIKIISREGGKATLGAVVVRKRKQEGRRDHLKSLGLEIERGDLKADQGGEVAIRNWDVAVEKGKANPIQSSCTYEGY